MPRKKQKRALITADSDYTQFLKSIDPIIIALVDSRFRVDRDQYFDKGSKKLSVAWSCVPVVVKSDYFEADANVVLKLGSEGKARPCVEIRATFQMHIHAAKPIVRAFVDRFTDSEVRILIWPYFREYISSVTGRMHIPPIILPMATRD